MIKRLKGGRDNQHLDQHAYILDHIQREDEIREKLQHKEKQHQQYLQEQQQKKQDDKPPQINMESPADKYQTLERDKAKVKVLIDTSIKSNFVGINKLFNIIHKENPKSTITREEVKTFLSVQPHEQILKQQVVKTKLQSGHITAIYPFEVIQLDIVFMPQFRKQNDNYKYFLVAVDVFTRKAYARPLMDKSIAEVKKEFLSIVKEMGKDPRIIMSDNDSTFLSDEFSEMCETMGIIMKPNIVGDHNFLGVIDNFCKRIELIFSKLFLINDNTKWVDPMQEVLDNYNNTPNSAVDDLTPDECLLKENYNNILDLNLLKSLKNRTVSDLKVGYFVRVKIGGKFTKASEPQWSDDVYKVTGINHNDITIS